MAVHFWFSRHRSFVRTVCLLLNASSDSDCMCACILNIRINTQTHRGDFKRFLEMELKDRLILLPLLIPLEIQFYAVGMLVQKVRLDSEGQLPAFESVQVSAAPLPFSSLITCLGKQRRVQICRPRETWTEFLDPDFSLAWDQSLQPSGEWARGWTLSPSLSLCNCFPNDKKEIHT